MVTEPVTTVDNDNSRITIKEIAEMARVSKTTVSRVINGKPDVSHSTRARVLDLIKETNFQPNLFATGKTAQKINHIGLIVPYKTHNILSNQYYVDVLQGILDEVERCDYYLFFCYVQKKNYVEIYKQKRVDGFILLSPGALHHSIINELKKEGIPFVSTAKVLDRPDIPFVEVDNYRGAEMAVEHLISLGHRRIAFVGKPSLTSNHDRLLGYQQTLELHGIQVDERYIQRVEASSVESGYEVMNQLLRMEAPPSALFSSCDIMAFGAMIAIQEKGLKVPDDISVIGFDDILLSRNMSPALTTIRQPAAHKGALAARQLIGYLSSGTKPLSQLLDVELIVRASTGLAK